MARRAAWRLRQRRQSAPAQSRRCWKNASRRGDQLAALQAAWHEVQPLDGVRQIAQRLLRLHPLRAADTLQLAAALLVCEHRPQGWQFVCLDARLSQAAEREGFRVIRNFAD